MNSEICGGRMIFFYLECVLVIFIIDYFFHLSIFFGGGKKW